MPIQRFNYRHFLAQNRLSESHALHPLFEAVENAFNAIEESKTSGGLVRIVVHRSENQKTIVDAKSGQRTGTPSEVTGFDVIDNGVGFTEENWKSFETLYTPHKEQTGGKGIGRLCYLQAFQSASIESTFNEKGKTFIRRFSMESTEAVTHGGELEETVDAVNETIVSLLPMRRELSAACPKPLDAIARRIVGHFFRRFSSPVGINCQLEDKWDGTTLDLLAFCSDEFLYEKNEPETISVRGYELTVTHTRCKTSAVRRHLVMLCGNGRVASTQSVPVEFTSTQKALKLDGERFFYIAFVEGKLLDDRVAPDRLSLELPTDDESGGLFTSESSEIPTIGAIVAEVGKSARKFLERVLEPLEAEHRQRITDFCRNNVILRPLIKHRVSELMAIRFGLSDEEFEQSVWRIYHDWKSDIRRQFQQMARTVRENSESLSEMKDSYRAILRQLSELAFHELAGYVSDRKAVVDFLWDRLAESETGRFHDEDAIHDIFFPRRKTSDDVPWDQSNLWLIDERLMYQQFVASDVPFAQHDQLGGGSMRRPDIASYYDRFFDATFAFAEGASPFTSVTLVEFKKPERERYTEDDNPVDQVAKYIREIRMLKSRTDSGHVFRIGQDSPIHVHVICHIVNDLEPFLGTTNYIRSPDGQGVIYHLPHFNAIVQFTTFEKLIADAKKRNEVFFEKLGINDATTGVS